MKPQPGLISDLMRAANRTAWGASLFILSIAGIHLASDDPLSPFATTHAPIKPASSYSAQVAPSANVAPPVKLKPDGKKTAVTQKKDASLNTVTDVRVQSVRDAYRRGLHM